jgi:uncharacterized protein (TIGR03084 family)
MERTMTTLLHLLDDLGAETATVDHLVAELDDADWELRTPAEGWAIRDQISHLAFFDDAAVSAATEPEAFRREADELIALGPGFPDVVASRSRTMPPADLLTWFRESRTRLLDVFSGLDGKTRVPWFGPEMSVTSSATARLMETWAHGQDVADALGVTRVDTDRLRHIAHLGVRTLGFSFALNGLDVPQDAVRVELDAPDGSVWAWGDESAVNTVTGPAVDFCLAVTQRRHRSDIDLVVTGAVATAWMSVAQAYAGAPGPGRPSPELEEREVG